MSEPMVVVDRLTKKYGRLTALSDVSLTIRRGEVLGLIGPNGAGKTTLFECLAGLLPYDAGTITFDGTPLTPRSRTTSIFYTPDGIAPWPAQTVEWALGFLTGFFESRISTVERAAIIERLSIGPLLGTPIGTLSKGQRKRVVLAAGMLAPQPLLLCDEPFDGLDLRQTREVGRALRDHAAAGRTLFLSIHQISDAARVCDRFVLLSGGRVCAEGTLAALQQLQTPHDQSRSLEEIFLALT
jgi:ABC-type multidrug transport system ATPase subunit